MRVTEKNTPVLKYLKWKKDLSHHKDMRPDHMDFMVPLREDIETGNFENGIAAMRKFIHDWPQFQPKFAKSIDIVSKEFMDTMLRSGRKLWNERMRSFMAGVSISGTLIWGKHVICYHITDSDGEQYEGEVLALHSNGLEFLVCSEGEFVSKRVERIFKEVGGSPGQYFTAIPMLFNLFKKYADVEVVEAKPFKKVEIPSEEDPTKKDTLLVDSSLPVKYYDCSWFRTIVRTEGFKVRGHFRMQRYKNEDGEWYYKLKYIDQYMKHGYRRTAKKIIAERK